LAGKERKEGAVQFAFCWAHARRKFFDFHHVTGSPIAAVERTIRPIKLGGKNHLFAGSDGSAEG
jgi:hypothetical protein